MAITFFNQYSLQPGTTSVALTPPASTAAGDLVVVYTTNKLSTTTPSNPAGWTLIGSQVVGTGADGSGTGPLRLTAWYQILTGAASGPTITISGGNSATGGGMVYRKAGGDTWNAPTAQWGSDTTSGTGFSASMAAQAGYAVGDWLLSVGTTSANTTLSARGITLPGCTVTYTGINSGGTLNGNDNFLWTDHEVVTAGSQSGVGVTTGTTAVATTGGAIQIRISLQSGTTGTAAPVEAADTSSASGILGYSGTTAVTQANQISSATGVLGYSGTVAVTQANQTSTASGTFTPAGFSGSVAVTQANQTSTASGVLGYSGSSARTQANQTSTASGTFTAAGVSGSVAATQAAQTSIAVGVLGYSGTSARTQAANVAAASGTVANPVTGTAAIIQASQFATATGTFQPLVLAGTAHAASMAAPTAAAVAYAVPSASPASGVASAANSAAGPAPTANNATGSAPTATGG